MGRVCVCGEDGADEKRSGGCESSVKVDLRFFHFLNVTVRSNPMGNSELKTFSSFLPLVVFWCRRRGSSCGSSCGISSRRTMSVLSLDNRVYLSSLLLLLLLMISSTGSSRTRQAS